MVATIARAGVFVQLIAFAVAFHAAGCDRSQATVASTRSVETTSARVSRTGTVRSEELHTLDRSDALFAAARGVAAVIPRAYLGGAPADGVMRVTAPTLGRSEQLCAGEPFAEQPSAASCTAVLIDDKLVATAGHCFKHAWDCRNYRFVFGYAYDGDRTLRIETADVYDCDRARIQESDGPGEEAVRDYAIVELTRPVRDRPILPVRTAALQVGEAVSVVSAAGGVPLKIDQRARVLDTRSGARDYFVLQSDTYRGSSGAPVLDAAGSVLGLFVRGSDDYALDSHSGCYRSRRWRANAGKPHSDGRRRDTSALTHDALAASQGHAAMTHQAPEQASYLQLALHALCASGYSSERLCRNDDPSRGSTDGHGASPLVPMGSVK